MIRLILDNPLERGKCYRISGHIAGNNIASFLVGNETEKIEIFQIATSPGSGADFSELFEYASDSTFFQSIYIDDISPSVPGADPVDVTEFSLTLDPSCATEYCSECFQKRECADPPNHEEIFLKWTNFDDGFGMNYTALPLVHSLWLKGGLRDDDYSYDEEYFSDSAGHNYPVYVDAIKSISMYVNPIPAYIHDALRLGVVHDEFSVNGTLYTKGDGGYSPDWDTPNSLLAPVIVKIREQTQNTKNQHC